MNNSIIDTLSVTFPVTYFKEFCNSGRMEDVRRVFRGDPYYLRKNIDESATVAEMKEQHSVDLMADFVAEWLYDFLGVDVVIQPIWRSGRNYFTYGFNFEGGSWRGAVIIVFMTSSDSFSFVLSVSKSTLMLRVARSI